MTGDSETATTGGTETVTPTTGGTETGGDTTGGTETGRDTVGTETGTGTGPATGGRRAWILAVAAPLVVVALAAGVLVVVAASGSESPAGHAGMAAAPLDLATVPGQVAAHYRAAATHRDAYAAIPCYCGCETFLAHRNLADCFVRPDGAGWEAHAAGCGVCLGESATARRLLDEGRPPDAVRAAVIAQFGSTPGTAPVPAAVRS